MKKAALTFMLVFSATAADAGVIKVLKSKSNVAEVTPAVSVPVIEMPLPTALPPEVIPAAPQAQLIQTPPPATQSNVVVIKKSIIGKANIAPAPVVTPIIETPIPEQHFVIFTEETKRQINEIVNCVDEPKGGGHDNVSAVPVPAALPLMATAFGIFGITRRRKAFK